MSVRILNADCLTALPQLAAEGFRAHAVVTDPPYHLTSIVKRFGSESAAPVKAGKTGAYARSSAGFMNQTWDGGDVAFRPETWRAVFECMLPGAHLAAFGGTRTWHRMAVAIEDAGFEIRDTLSWNYGSGFPKSHSVNKALDGIICSCDEPALSPQEGRSVHPVRDVRSDVASISVPFEAQREGVLQLLVSQQNVCGSVQSDISEGLVGNDAGKPCSEDRASKRADEPCLEGGSDLPEQEGELRPGPICAVPAGVSEHGQNGRLRNGAPPGDGPLDRPDAQQDGVCASHRPQSAEQSTQQSGPMAGQPQPQDGGAWPVCQRCGKPHITKGLGSALKPAWEPIILARKPLDGTVAANTLRHGCGGLNIDASRIPTSDDLNGGAYAEAGGRSVSQSLHGGSGMNVAGKTVGKEFVQPSGRWPANVVLSDDPEVEEAFARFGETKTTVRGENCGRSGGNKTGNGIYSDLQQRGYKPGTTHADTGSASRFFYTAKADAADRAGSKHPTVKPTALMRWLVQLVCPPGGTVLDPFAGTGSTGLAADQLGMNAVLIERDAQYAADARRKIASDAPLFTEVA